MIRAPGFVTEAQARDVKAVASQELATIWRGLPLLRQSGSNIDAQNTGSASTTPHSPNAP